MVKYKGTNITAKKGINFVRGIVEDSGCLFHKIEQENDLGIDGIVELLKGETPAHKSLAVQIKSGPSYYNSKKNECLIPIESHFEYWLNHPLPVCGIVFIPELGLGYWINIKAYLKDNKEAKVIKFIGNRSNQFDALNFKRLFVPNVLNETPELDQATAISLFNSDHENEFVLGSVVLFRRFVNSPETWSCFLKHLENEELPSRRIIHYLSHIPWHPDIFYSGEMINKEINEYVLDKLNTLPKEVVLKLISEITEEEGIQRGTIGQSIEAILSKVNGIREYLQEFILDENLPIHSRNASVVIYAYYYESGSLPFFQKVSDGNLWLIPELIKHIKEFEYFNPYQ